MKCIGCGKEINTDSKFCKYCATPVQKSIEAHMEEERNKIQCPECKRMVKTGNIYCTYCGAPLTGGGDNKPQSGGLGRKILKIILFSTLLIAVILLAIVILYFVKFKDRQSDGIETTTQSTMQTTSTTTSATTSAIPVDPSNDNTSVPSQQGRTLPYTDNSSINFYACLSPSAFEEVTSSNGEFSFAYPKYVFNGSECDDVNNDYKFYYNNGSQNEVYLHYYEETQEGEVLANIQSLRQRFSGVIANQYYERVSDKVDSEGMARVLLGGYTDSTNTEGVYIIAANNGRKNYIMEFYYPDSDYKDLYKEVNYVVDCLYRFCSYSGGTYKPRTHQQFLKDEWGEKK